MESAVLNGDGLDTNTDIELDEAWDELSWASTDNGSTGGPLADERFIL